MSQEDVQNTAEQLVLTQEQIDITGEVSNISMGSAATALSNIIGKKVLITSPRVQIGSEESLDMINQIPSVSVTISYTEGVVGQNFLIIRQEDAEKIVEVLMGGEVPEDDGFGELHLSAIGEVMNQMMGSAATALSGFIGRPVNISPPNAFVLTEENKEEHLDFLYNDLSRTIFVRFVFSVEDMFDSDIFMIMTYEFMLELVDAMLSSMGISPEKDASSQPESIPQPKSDAPDEEPAAAPTPPKPAKQPSPEAYQPPAPPSTPPAPPSPPPAPRAPVAPTAVRPATLPDFGPAETMDASSAANFELIQDVPLELSVEVGKARKLVKEIMEFSVGTIIELDKQAGDPVDIVVSGQLIARGEVVVIDESFGVRVTEIVGKNKGR